MDGKGKLTARKPGTAQITVKIADYIWEQKVKVVNSLPAAVRYGIYEGLDKQEEKLAHIHMVPVPVKAKQIPNMGNSTARPVNKLVFYTQRIEEKFHGMNILW